MKRAFDLVAAGVGLIVLSPLMAIIAVLVRRGSDGPVLFRQERVGRAGHPFTMLKFRSMLTSPQVPGPLITASSDTRITPIGATLRTYKLDELPQLINVARGDMSIVGPRPEVPEYVALWDRADREVILSVRPGLTDPATLELRGEEALLRARPDPEAFYRDVLLPRKVSLYREYVQGRTFWRDARLIGRTLGAIVANDRGESPRPTSSRPRR